MKEILNHLFEHKTLYKSEAKEILKNIAQGQYNAAQVAAFMTVFLMRNITVEELEGFKEAMLELCVQVEMADIPTIDVCGTGGDGKDTFNISTLSAFVVAACGVKVAKHGNYGVSSISGSSNVLEFLGYKFPSEPAAIRYDIETFGLCFMHAPLFHPAMKVVAPIRKELGVKTFFNMLGPMVNPARPSHQLVGVFSLELARLYAYLYQKGTQKFIILHSLDGYDEISLTAAFKVFSLHTESIYQPQELGFDWLQPHELLGGKTLADSAQIFLSVLENTCTSAQKSVVVANAGWALHCALPHLDLPTCFALAQEKIENGDAYKLFKQFIEQSKKNRNLPT